MPKIERSEDSPMWEIEYDTNGFEGSPLFLKFMRAIDALHNAEPLAAFSLKQDNEDPTRYRYRFETVDSRKWTQWFIRAGESFRFTINVPDEFSAAIFPLHTALRELIGEIILTHELTKIEMNW